MNATKTTKYYEDRGFTRYSITSYGMLFSRLEDPAEPTSARQYLATDLNGVIIADVRGVPQASSRKVAKALTATLID